MPRPVRPRSLSDVHGIGQRPAAASQPGLDSVDVGVGRLVMGDVGDGRAEFLVIIWFGLLLFPVPSTIALT